MSRSSVLRIGILGAGFLAETRARTWRRVFGVDVELAGVAARSADRAQAFAKRHRVKRAFSDPEALCSSSDVDLVDVCVPNRWHRLFVERAAAAKKHVLCTKPLSAYVGQDLGPEPDPAAVGRRDPRIMYRTAVEDARVMVGACKAAGVALHYGENWVHAPSVVRAAELAASSGGVLLEMRGWEAHSGSHSPYSKRWLDTGGGALLRLGSHPIGTMLWLKREEGLRSGGAAIRVEAVTAEVADPTRHPALTAANTAVARGWEDVESWGSVVLAFEDGSRGIALGSDLMLGGMQSRLQLLGSDYHLECNLSPNDLLRSHAAHDETFGDAYVMEKASGQAGWNTPIPDEDWSSGQQGLCQAVAEAAHQGRASAADGELGLEVTRVLYAAYVSAAEGSRVNLDALES